MEVSISGRFPIAVPTAKQWWAYARAWLTVEMQDERRRWFFDRQNGSQKYVTDLFILLVHRMRMKD